MSDDMDDCRYQWLSALLLSTYSSTTDLIEAESVRQRPACHYSWLSRFNHLFARSSLVVCSIPLLKHRATICGPANASAATKSFNHGAFHMSFMLSFDNKQNCLSIKGRHLRGYLAALVWPFSCERITLTYAPHQHHHHHHHNILY